nr:MAG TPA: hypothetical protein [Bacteriophage sp.]
MAKKDIYPDAIDGDSSILINAGYDEFTKVISSSLVEPYNDIAEKHLSLLSLHDKVYGLKDVDDGTPEASSHDLYPYNMKRAYVLHGEGSYLKSVIEDFTINQVSKYTGLDLAQWMHMTEIHQRMILDVAMRMRREEQRISNEVSQEVANNTKVS